MALALALGRGRRRRPDAAMVVLENSAGSGFGLGIDVDGARRHRRGRRGSRPAGASGSASASTRPTPGAPGSTSSEPAAIDAFLADFDDRIGLERLVMIHLNDSKSELRLAARSPRAPRRRPDRRGRAGATCCATRRSPTSRTSSRRPGWTRATTRSTSRVRYDIAACRPLADLPPEAMTLRGSRARTGPAAGRARGRGRVTTGSAARPRTRRSSWSRSACSCSRPCCGSRTSPRAARGTPTRATTCSMLRALVRDGVVPLLGPPTSIGDVHHGALYYYLLAPAAFLTGGDSPLAVVGAHRAGRDRRGRS